MYMYNYNVSYRFSFQHYFLISIMGLNLSIMGYVNVKHNTLVSLKLTALKFSDF